MGQTETERQFDNRSLAAGEELGPERTRYTRDFFRKAVPQLGKRSKYVQGWWLLQATDELDLPPWGRYSSYTPEEARQIAKHLGQRIEPEIRGGRKLKAYYEEYQAKNQNKPPEPVTQAPPEMSRIKVDSTVLRLVAEPAVTNLIILPDKPNYPLWDIKPVIDPQGLLDTKVVPNPVYRWVQLALNANPKIPRTGIGPGIKIENAGMKSLLATIEELRLQQRQELGLDLTRTVLSPIANKEDLARVSCINILRNLAKDIPDYQYIVSGRPDTEVFIVLLYETMQKYWAAGAEDLKAFSQGVAGIPIPGWRSTEQKSSGFSVKEKQVSLCCASMQKLELSLPEIINTLWRKISFDPTLGEYTYVSSLARGIPSLQGLSSGGRSNRIKQTLERLGIPVMREVHGTTYRNLIFQADAERFKEALLGNTVIEQSEEHVIARPDTESVPSTPEVLPTPTQEAHFKTESPVKPKPLKGSGVIHERIRRKSRGGKRLKPPPFLPGLRANRPVLPEKSRSLAEFQSVVDPDNLLERSCLLPFVTAALRTNQQLRISGTGESINVSEDDFPELIKGVNEVRNQIKKDLWKDIALRILSVFANDLSFEAFRNYRNIINDCAGKVTYFRFITGGLSMEQIFIEAIAETLDEFWVVGQNPTPRDLARYPENDQRIIRQLSQIRNRGWEKPKIIEIIRRRLPLTPKE